MTALSAIALSEDRRARAAALVQDRGLPHRRIEEWKYSDLRAVLGEAGLSAVVAQYLIRNLPHGMDVWDLSRPDAPAWVTDNFARETGNTMNAASLAVADAGIALRVPAGMAIDDPLKLDFTGAGHVRALLVVEAGASLNLVEGVVAADFRNVGFEIALGEGARLEHVRICPALDGAVLVEEAAVRIAAGATYRGHFTGFGARLSRMELEIALEGTGAQAHLSGVALLDGRHSDITTHVSHLVGDTHSSQLFKHVAAGKGRAVYQGKVTVAKGANGADSSQTAKALLLGDAAEADLKPELEIFADDVKCAHGAAVGDLDAESLFYLRARGIPEAQARRMLLQAFLEDAVAEVGHAESREMARTELLAALEKVA
ncbi:MAG: SufD family Fe-S cluster assembly protein [Alphaproteobacteria bacterium]|nr:SufD family Fe-S cluster assembly protein [Alphaproteobacteria bacterium]